MNFSSKNFLAAVNYFYIDQTTAFGNQDYTDQNNSLAAQQILMYLPQKKLLNFYPLKLSVNHNARVSVLLHKLSQQVFLRTEVFQLNLLAQINLIQINYNVYAAYKAQFGKLKVEENNKLMVNQLDQS